MKIDERTFGRLVDKGQEYKEVKLCVYNMITTLNSYSSYDTQNKAISSETTDGYSISYGTPQKSITEAKNSELEDIIDTYLSNLIVDDVRVLYRGTDQIRVPYDLNPSLDYNNFAIEDILVQGEYEDIVSENDLKDLNIPYYNITSLNNNIFGNNKHIHVSGK